MADPNTSSAEWIAEAPTVCATSRYCRELALTDFGTVAFSNARTASGGHSGVISDPVWQSSQVSLEGHSAGFGYGRFGGQAPAVWAVPSALIRGGGSFSVTWSGRQPAAGGTEGGYGPGEVAATRRP